MLPSGGEQPDGLKCRPSASIIEGMKGTPQRSVVLFVFARQVERMKRLNRGNGMFVDELHHAVTLQQHAEQVERRDLTLEHDAVD